MNALIMKVKKISKKMFNYRLLSRAANSQLSSILMFAVIFFIICSDTLVSIFPMYPSSQTSEEIFELSQVTSRKQQIDEVDREAVDPLIPPFNATKGERIAWFRRKSPELEILNSTELSQKFHGRVLEFFNKCTFQFFMTWLLPAETFGKREFLAMDSLFKANPHACLIIVSRSLDSIEGYQILKPVLDRGFQVLAVTPDIPFLLKNTPAKAWFDEIKSGRRDPGSISLSVNLSKLLRFAILFKYGGIYLDPDFIVLKDFMTLRNAIGAQSADQVTNQWRRINDAVMMFDINHPILEDFIKEFVKSFNGNKWGQNQPYLISRVVERVRIKPSYNVTILQPQAFYPVDWMKIDGLFRKPANTAEKKWTEETLHGLTESYALHLWNKKTRNLTIQAGSAMDRLILENCVVCKKIKPS